jgi:hypothetical protein
MSDPDKSLTTEVKLFELYGLRRVINAANTYKIASSDFVPLAEALLPETQARAFAARWPTLTADEQTQICTMLEKDHG